MLACVAACGSGAGATSDDVPKRLDTVMNDICPVPYVGMTAQRSVVPDVQLVLMQAVVVTVAVAVRSTPANSRPSVVMIEPPVVGLQIRMGVHCDCAATLPAAGASEIVCISASASAVTAGLCVHRFIVISRVC